MILFMPFVIVLLMMVVLLCFRKWALGLGFVVLVLNCWNKTFALNVFSLNYLKKAAHHKRCAVFLLFLLSLFS